MTAKTDLVGKSSVKAAVGIYGGRLNLLCPTLRGKAPAMLRNKKSLSFWFKAANPNSHSWQDVNPLIVIYDNNQRSAQYITNRNLLSSPQYAEADGWISIEVPLAGDDVWQRVGADLTSTSSVSIGVDSWGNDP